MGEHAIIGLASWVSREQEESHGKERCESGSGALDQVDRSE